MFPARYEYEINCPRCNKLIKHKGVGDRVEYIYNKMSVVKERCPRCLKKILVKINKYAIGKVDYEHALPIIKEKYGCYLEINEQTYERLREQEIFVENKEDLVISNYDREKLIVVMH